MNLDSITPETLSAIAVFFMVLEVVFGFPLILFFIGLGFLTLAAVTSLQIVADTYQAHIQLALALAFALAWTALLWIPLQKAITRKSGNYSNLIGQEAIVVSSPLIKGSVGKINFSGSTFKARMDDQHPTDKIEANTSVIILDVQENILIVKIK